MSPDHPDDSDPSKNDPKEQSGADVGDDSVADAWASFDEGREDWSHLSREGPLARPKAGGGEETNPAVKAAPVPLKGSSGLHLVVTAGQEIGRTFALSGMALRIGRSSSNQIRLADPSISREHARIEVRDDAWVLLDLKSGNGTFFNGARITEAAIKDGDQIGLGQVRLAVRSALKLGPKSTAPAVAGRPTTQLGPKMPARPEAQAASPATQPPSAKTWRNLPQLKESRFLRLRLRRRWLAIATSMALLLGWAWVVRHNRGQRRYAFAMYQSGAAALRVRDVNGALRAANEAVAKAPTMKAAQALLLAAQKTHGAQKRLAEAEEAFKAGRLGEAAHISQSLLWSVLHPEARQLVQKVRPALDASAFVAYSALRAQDGKGAQLALAALGADFANRPDAKIFSAWAQSLEALAPAIAQAQTLRSKKGPPQGPWTQPNSRTLKSRAAVRAFVHALPQHAAEQALAKLHGRLTPAEEALHKDLVKLAELIDMGLIEHRGKRAFMAIKVLTQARALATEIASGPSATAHFIDGKMADMYYVLGVQALSSGAFAEAATSLHTAVALHPGHALSTRKLDELQTRAEKLLDEAEVNEVGDPNKARELCRQVLEAMPKTSSVFRRARKILGRLGHSG